MLLLDSSVIIAAFRANEKNHREALSILKNNRNFLINDYVLSEVLTVLKMREGHEVAVKCLDFLQNNENIEIRGVDSRLLNTALDYFRQHQNKLSFVDTLLLVTKHLEAIKLATFDQDLQKSLLVNDFSDLQFTDTKNLSRKIDDILYQ